MGREVRGGVVWGCLVLGLGLGACSADEPAGSGGAAGSAAASGGRTGGSAGVATLAGSSGASATGGAEAGPFVGGGAHAGGSSGRGGTSGQAAHGGDTSVAGGADAGSTSSTGAHSGKGGAENTNSGGSAEADGGAGETAIGAGGTGGVGGSSGLGGSAGTGPVGTGWLWAERDGRAFGGRPRLTSTTTLPSGVTYAVGYFTGFATFGATVLASAGQNDAFIVKYAADGSVIWARSAGGKYDDKASSVAALPDGSVIVVGACTDDASFNGVSPAAHGGGDAFMAKYDASGAILWAVRLGDAGPDEATSVAVLADGTAYVAGNAQSGSTIGGMMLGSGLSQSTRAFLVKLDVDGDLAFAVDPTLTASTAGAVATLADGSVYLTGGFTGSATFGTSVLSSNGSSVSDLFVAKYDAAGHPLWAAQSGSTHADYGSALAVLADGTVYVAGTYWNLGMSLAQYSSTGSRLWLVQDASATQMTPTALGALTDGTLFVGGSFRSTIHIGGTTLKSASFDAGDGFLAKYDASGTPLSAIAVTLNNNDAIRGLGLLTDGTVYLGGNFTASCTFGSTTLATNGGDDIYLAKLTPSGSWASAVRGGFYWGSAVTPSHMAALPDGGSVVTGVFAGAVDFGDTRLVAAGGWDIYVVKHDADGAPLWAVRAGGEEQDTSTAVAVAPDGSIFVTGQFSGDAEFGSTRLTAGYTDVFLAKYAANGSLLWVEQAGGTSYDYGVSLAALGDGSVLLLGTFGWIATIGGTELAPKSNGTDLFLAKFDASGNLVWVTREGAGSASIEPAALAALSDGSSYVTGWYSGSAVFGSIPVTHATAGFLATYGSDGKAKTLAEMPGSSSVRPLSVAAQADGSARVTGYFLGTADFGGKGLTSPAGNSAEDLFLAKYAADECEWVVQANTTMAHGDAVSVLPDGSAYVGATYFMSVGQTQMPFGNTTLQVVGGNWDIVLAKYAADGELIAAWPAGSGSDDKVAGIAALSDGSALVSGSYIGSATIGATTLENFGTSEGFLARVNASK